MRSVFQDTVLDELIVRVQRLTAQSVPKWGEMNVVQMMAHCNESSKVALGVKKSKRMFVGRLFGKMILRKVLKNDKPLKKNSPTAPGFIIKDKREFTKEKDDFIRVLSKLQTMQIEDFNGKVHPFFGEMNGSEWSVLIYKHFNHHLEQFGV